MRASLSVPVLLLTSLGLTFGVVSHALSVKKHFYPSTVYIANSGLSMMFIYYQLAVLGYSAAKVLQKIFFGRLRPVELEHVYDKAWFAVTETCLAMTIFRDEFTAKFAAQFMLLLVIKIFHWLCQDRVDFMEQSTNINRTFHIRMVAVTALLASADIFMAYSAATKLRTEGPSMQLLFGFEYIVLSMMILSTFIKYVLQLIDLNSENGWDDKSIYINYIDFAQDLVKLAVYMVFFIVIMNFYGLPLHILRDLFSTFRSFAKRLHDLIQSRKATRNLETRYPDPTPEDLAAVDSICVICRDEMQANNPDAPCKKLPCGHIFHLRCLRSWLQRQQICPTCRADVFEMEPQRQVHHAHDHLRNVPAAAAAAAAAANFNANANANAAGPNPNANNANAPQNNAVPAPVPAAHAAGVTVTQPPPSVPMANAGLNVPNVPGGPMHTPAGMTAPMQGLTQTGSPSLFPTTPMSPFPPLPTPPNMMYGVPPFPSPLPGTLPGMGFGMQPGSHPPGFVPFNFSAQLQTPISQLSELELRNLEGEERDKVILRIEFLRKFRAEMDAMLARFGQYEKIAATPQEQDMPSAPIFSSPRDVRSDSRRAPLRQEESPLKTSFTPQQAQQADQAESKSKHKSTAAQESASAASDPSSIAGNSVPGPKRTRTREEEERRQLLLRNRLAGNAGDGGVAEREVDVADLESEVD